MWSPNDWNSLPKQAERLLAIKYIKASEQSLKKSSKSKLHAKRLRCWIAPVRRLPDDVLSIIFVETCRIEWQAALILGAVCRWWRHVLLGTPRAWACIEIVPDNTVMHHKLLDIWLSRCGSLKLHVSLPPRASPDTVKMVCSHDKNLQCLSFFNNGNVLGNEFLQLVELRLGPQSRYTYEHPTYSRSSESIRLSDIKLPEEEEEEEELNILNVKRFPKLVSLHLHSPSVHTMRLIAQIRSFPPLQELHIHAMTQYWLQIIKIFAASLVTLTIEFTSEYSTEIPDKDLLTPLPLKKLRHLSYINKAPIHQPAPCLRTPALEVYQEFSLWGRMHLDVSSVTSVSIHASHEPIDWSKFTSVTHIKIGGEPESIFQSLLPLEANVKLCPKLSSVECVKSTSAVVDRVAPSLKRRSLLTGMPIRISVIDFRPREFYVRCFTYCGHDTSPERGGQYDDYYDEEHYMLYNGFICEDCGEEHDEESPCADEYYRFRNCSECGEYHSGKTCSGSGSDADSGSDS